MAERFDNNEGGGFVIGLLTGTALGIGLGMLFAPKAGAGEQALAASGASHIILRTSWVYGATGKTEEINFSFLTNLSLKFLISRPYGS